MDYGKRAEHDAWLFYINIFGIIHGVISIKLWYFRRGEYVNKPRMLISYRISDIS